MARAYYVNRNANKAAAHHIETQAALDDEANDIAGRAEALLARHRKTGHSHIEVSNAIPDRERTSIRGIDRFVSLVDVPGNRKSDYAAMSIEMGRTKDTTNPRGPSKGIHILIRAAGLKAFGAYGNGR